MPNTPTIVELLTSTRDGIEFMAMRKMAARAIENLIAMVPHDEECALYVSAPVAIARAWFGRTPDCNCTRDARIAGATQ